MCNLNLPDIYATYIKYLQNDAQLSQMSSSCPELSASLVGLIYTVKQFLLNMGTKRSSSSFLNQLVKPYFTPNRVIEQGYPQVPLSLEFLNLFVKYAAADIPQIMLKSPAIADAISGELINYLKYLDKL